jgi:hypothetical protein
MTFTAMANLLKNDSFGQEDSAKVRDFSLKAWDLVESCQVVPILLLDQYPPTAGEEMLRSITGLKFPVSSTSLVGAGLFSAEKLQGLPVISSHFFPHLW